MKKEENGLMKAQNRHQMTTGERAIYFLTNE